MYKKSNEEKTPQKHIDIGKYQNVEDFDLGKLSFGLWWVKNKHSLKIALVIVLTIVSLFSVGYTIFNWGKYFLVSREADEAMIRQLVLSETVSGEFLKERAAKNIIESALGVSSSEKMYDLYVSLQNPNKDYFGLISYCFILNTNESDCGNSFILPDEKKYILSLGNDLGGFPRNARFEIKSSSWSRIDKHNIPSWPNFRDEHLNLQIKDIEFEAGEGNELSEKLNINLLTFSIKNNTPYSYYEVPLNLILFSKNRVSSVSRYVLKDFDSNEEENVKIVWPGIVGSISDVEIMADLDITSNDIYKD